MAVESLISPTRFQEARSWHPTVSSRSPHFFPVGLQRQGCSHWNERRRSGYYIRTYCMMLWVITLDARISFSLCNRISIIFFFPQEAFFLSHKKYQLLRSKHWIQCSVCLQRHRTSLCKVVKIKAKKHNQRNGALQQEGSGFKSTRLGPSGFS